MKAAHVGYLALALLAGSAGYLAQQRLQPPPAVPLAAEAPAPAPASPAVPSDLFAWSFRDPAGKTQGLEQWRGRLLVLNFWATWCPPCLKEIPTFLALQHELGPRGLQFVGIAMDQEDAVRTFVADKGVDYPVLLGDQDVARLMTSLGNEIGGLPYTVVVGRDGKVLAKHQGEWEAADARRALEGFLATP